MNRPDQEAPDLTPDGLAPERVFQRDTRQTADQEASRVLAGRLLRLAGHNASPKPGAVDTGCSAFDSLVPRSVFAGMDGDAGPCYHLSPIRCLETSNGFFVPVIREGEYPCYWHLWYVPKVGVSKGICKETSFQGTAHRSHFTAGMVADDINNDGIVEAAITVDSSDHSIPKRVILIAPDGERTDTPFAELRDVDNDGRLDGIAEFRFIPGDGTAARNAELSRISLVAHRGRNGEFSLDDEVAAKQRKKTCRPPIAPLLVVNPRGHFDWNEMLRRVVCDVVGGSTPEETENRLVEQCRSAKRLLEDCDDLRAPFEGPAKSAAMLASWARPH